MTTVLSLSKVKKTYVTRKGFLRWRKESIPALNGISFRIKQGEIFGLLGPNGAGKTTTVNIIAGIVLKDGGSIEFLGQELVPSMRNQMNVATAYAGLMGELTVQQNLNVFAHIYNIPNPPEKIAELLRTFRVSHLKDKRFYTLSSGEKTRISLCKGLLNDPELLLLDEATVGLDPDIAAGVRDQIKSLNTTILFTSHNMNEIEELCSRIAFLNHGTIITTGTPKELTRLIKEQRVIIDFYPTNKDINEVLKSLGVNVAEHTASRFVLNIPNADRKLHDILHPLLTQGIKIRDMSIEKPSLEEVFISIIADINN